MIPVLVFIFGLCIGSFLGVCIVRLPKGEESVVTGRSHCPHCKKTIPWYDNLPLLSFLLLRGRCRHCGGSISWFYPVIEVVSGILFVVMYAFFGLGVSLLFYSYLGFSLLVATCVDLEHQMIPDEVNFLGIIVGLTASYFFPELHGEWDRRLGLADSALGMLMGIALIYGIAVLGRILFRKESMGGGDLKLLAMIGTFLGFKKVAIAFFLAPFFATPIGLVLKFKKKQEIMPYGPYLSLASLISLFWGEVILDFVLTR